MAELALDDVHRHPFAREFDRVRVAELMRGAPATDPCLSGELTQLTTGSGRCPAPAAGRAVDDAEQRSHGERDAVHHPGGELFEAESVHPGFAALVALCCAQNYVALARMWATFAWDRACRRNIFRSG